MNNDASKCPFNRVMQKLKPGLPPLTRRLAKLPVDVRGYPVPFFVEQDGRPDPDFWLASSEKLERCLRERLCWVCGQGIGNTFAFVIGPMCLVNMTSGEPPSHPDCAEWSVKGCPFLSKPKMTRREDDLSDSLKKNVAGLMLERNPGAIAILVTKSFKLFSPPMGGRLFNIGAPERITFWREGRPATRAEVFESMTGGLPNLEAVCYSETELKALRLAVEKAVAVVCKTIPGTDLFVYDNTGKTTPEK